MSSVFCKKIKKFLENFQKTLQKCKSKYKRVGSFVKKCLKIAVLLSCHGVSASPRGGIDPSFWAQNGAGFLSCTLKETKPEFVCKRTKKLCFLLDAKRNKSGRGNFPSFPLHPKTPHTPTNIIFRTSWTTAPLSKGAKGSVNKRISKMGEEALKRFGRSRKSEKECVFLQLRRTARNAVRC